MPKKLIVFLKNDRVQNIGFDVESATITTDEHGYLYVHHGQDLLCVVSAQEFVAVSLAEVS